MQEIEDRSIAEFTKRQSHVTIHERKTLDTLTPIQNKENNLAIREGGASRIIQRMNGTTIVVIDQVTPRGIFSHRRYAIDNTYSILKQYEALKLPLPPFRNSVPLQLAKLLHLRK